jgi:hypothetical protein
LQFPRHHRHGHGELRSPTGKTGIFALFGQDGSGMGRSIACGFSIGETDSDETQIGVAQHALRLLVVLKSRPVFSSRRVGFGLL